jgi:rhodanese-related sulfurtransferase
VLDLRQERDYDSVHVCGSVNDPLEGLNSATGDIFGNSKMIELFWTRLRTKFKESENLGSKKLSLIVICYDGETSRLGTSILRAKGYTAYSISGGFRSLAEYISTGK